jgi:hypothetical protein
MLEDEKRSKSRFKPITFLGGCLALMFVVMFVIVAIDTIFGKAAAPRDAYIVRADGTQGCILSNDTDLSKHSYEYVTEIVQSPEVFALCGQYTGQHVHLTFGEKSRRIDTIVPIK